LKFLFDKPKMIATKTNVFGMITLKTGSSFLLAIYTVLPNISCILFGPVEKVAINI